MRHAVFFITLLLSLSLAQAEVVTLSNGDVLRGKVLSQDESQMTLEHPSLGSITISKAQIASVRTEASEEVETKAAQARAAAAAAEEHARAASTAATAQDAKTAADAAKAQADAAVAAADAAIKAATPPPSGFFDGWVSRFELGVTGTDGNSETLAGRAAFLTKRETQRHRWVYDASYSITTDQGDRTSNEFTTGLLKDWFFPPGPWLLFASGRYEYDEFEAWDSRVQGVGGVGYRFIKSDDAELTGRVGMGAIKEFGSDDEDVRPEALIGLEGFWKFAPNQRIAGSTYYHPDVSDISQGRTVSTFEYIITIDRDRGVSLKLGLENEYENRTEGDAMHNDLKYFTTLLWEF